MKKLADISAFEGLQNRVHASMGSDMMIFNKDGDILIPPSVVKELDRMYEKRVEPPGKPVMGLPPDKWLDGVALDLCIAMTKQLGFKWTLNKEKANKVWDALEKAMQVEVRGAKYEDGSARDWMNEFLNNTISYVRSWDGSYEVKMACGYVDEDGYPLDDEEIEE